MKYVQKQVVALIAPYIVELFNRFLATGHFPAGFKEVVVLVLSRLGYDNGVSSCHVRRVADSNQC